MQEQKLLASIVIPVYNQYISLCKTLFGFSHQTVDCSLFEVILVDDGSNDELFEIGKKIFEKYGSLQGQYCRQVNLGRAAARNTGIHFARADIIIFCDADRYPSNNFVEEHIIAHHEGDEIVIGYSYDYFGRLQYLDSLDWGNIQRYSRCPAYLKKVATLYDQTGHTDSSLAWISFLVGNASVRKEILYNIGGFNEEFKEWGVEHFELALRLYKRGKQFRLCACACNYHIPHSRGNGFYKDSLQKSLQLFGSYHHDINVNELMSIMLDPKYPLPKTLFINGGKHE